LQCEIGVYVDPLQDAVPHETVVAACWQAPAPLQLPVLPQGGLAAHSPWGSVVPSATLAQLPAAPGTLHAWQVPQAVALQHTPSTQVAPVRQSLVDEQGWPRRCLLPHLFRAVSQIPCEQSPSPVHAALQAVEPLQTYGAHDSVVAAWQTPRPSQVRPEVCVVEPLGQVGAAQAVPAP
jgi:hypothetical protein